MIDTIELELEHFENTRSVAQKADFPRDEIVHKIVDLDPKGKEKCD